MLKASTARERFELAAQTNASCDPERIQAACQPLVEILSVRLKYDSDAETIIEHMVAAKQLKILLGLDDTHYRCLKVLVPLNTPLETLIMAGWFVGSPSTEGLEICTINNQQK